MRTSANIVAGNKTALAAYYPEAMARCIDTSLYPSVTDKDVPAMPTCAFKQHDHVPSDQPEPELESTVFAGVHHLIEGRDWHKHVGHQEAIDKEANGSIANQTWSYDEVVSSDVLLARKEPLNIRRLMTILSIKQFWGVHQVKLSDQPLHFFSIRETGAGPLPQVGRRQTIAAAAGGGPTAGRNKSNQLLKL